MATRTKNTNLDAKISNPLERLRGLIRLFVSLDVLLFAGLFLVIWFLSWIAFDYGVFKAAELSRHRQSADSPPALWRLPDQRTLRVISRPRPSGGMTLVYSDISAELRLKTQFNQLISVQRATLDKLNDAVAVFGADARLQLHNEAFAQFWHFVTLSSRR